jgi:hypothetical protein
VRIIALDDGDELMDIAKVAADLDVGEADEADTDEIAVLDDGATGEAGETPETGE